MRALLPRRSKATNERAKAEEEADHEDEGGGDGDEGGDGGDGDGGARTHANTPQRDGRNGKEKKHWP